MNKIFQILMFTDIFSSFDPATSSLYSNWPTILFWITNILILLMLHASIWNSPSQIFWLNSFPINIMHTQVNQTLGKNIKGFTSLISPLFIILIIRNLTGLIPYIFRVTRHLLFTLTFGLPLWLALIISSITLTPTSFLAALLPAGAPAWLNPFLTLVETLRTAVRPITLSFRLAANISAGHIILGLLGIYTTWRIFALPIYSFLALIITTIIYTIFEVAICLIQAYIFCLLLSLYSEDHPS